MRELAESSGVARRALLVALQAEEQLPALLGPEPLILELLPQGWQVSRWRASQRAVRLPSSLRLEPPLSQAGPQEAAEPAAC